MSRWGRIAIPASRAASVAWHRIGDDGLTACGQDIEAKPATLAGVRAWEEPRPVVYHDGIVPPSHDRCATVCPRCAERANDQEVEGGAGA